ncbi:unnamed protein product [Paramecium pentaurelia]|uniref:t-SNARE coiled-coil homology domain-containing protein n=1 Tax=Paramecium pentaurelia TaxID=43138 RepID=A0A8S1VPK1_9CILI|nr:unnamed protein product [Paramecium pentaurelia]
MFTELAYNASKRINQIQTDLQTREKLQQSSKSTGFIDAEINSTLKYLDNELDQLDQEIKGYIANQNSNLLAKEIQKRRNLYNELAQKRQEIKKRIEQSHITHLQQQLIQNKQKKKNYESFGQMDALKMHGQITDKQDEYLNKINDKVLNIKYSSQNLSKQIKEQNGIIDQLHEDTDSTNQAMKKLKNKMNYFLDQSNSWQLLIILFLEIFVFIFVVII